MPDTIRAHVGVSHSPARTSLFARPRWLRRGLPGRGASPRKSTASLACRLLRGRVRARPLRRRRAGADARRHLLRHRHGDHAGAHPRARAERMDAQARAEIMALKAEVDRVASAAPVRAAGDRGVARRPARSRTSWATPSIVTSAPVARRALAFGTWLAPDQARAMERAVEALRSRGEGFDHGADDARRAPHRGGRPRASATARCSGCKDVERRHARAGRSWRTPRQAPARGRYAAGADRGAAVAGLGARCDRQAGVRQSRPMCARSRRGSSAEVDRARAGTARPHGARGSEPGAGGGRTLHGAAAGDRRRHAAHPRRARDCRRAAAPAASASMPPRWKRCAASSPAWSTRTAACSTSSTTAVAIFGADQRLELLQLLVPRAVGPRCRLSRSEPDRFGRARPLRAARKLPEQADFRLWKQRAARSLPRARIEGALVAPAGRAHAARRHDAGSGRRRHLPVRRRHRAPRARAPLRCADPGAGGDPRQSRRGGRGVRRATVACGCTIPPSRACGSCRRSCSTSSRTSRR